MIDFDKYGNITTYGPRCTYCMISDKGYWHWTHALIHNEETRKALCKCKEMKE
jgi:hypothetical protein